MTHGINFRLLDSCWLFKCCKLISVTHHKEQIFHVKLSVIGPLFGLCMLPQGTAKNKLCIYVHYYADDTQLYIIVIADCMAPLTPLELHRPPTQLGQNR